MKISDKKIQDIIQFYPHKKQQEVLDCKNRELAIAAGVRGGKSAIAAYIVLKELLKDDKNIWIVAPSYDLTQRVFEYVQRWYIEIIGQEGSGHLFSRPNGIQTPWGSRVECKSAEETPSLLGAELDLAVLDECSRMKKDVYERYIMARLAGREGKAIFISTPFGQNWFFRKWKECKQLGGAFHWTSLENPSERGIGKKEWDRIKKLAPETLFKQEYEASFEPDVGAVFRGIPDIIDDTFKDREEGVWYVMGVDLAKIRDFTVITVMDRQTKQVVYLDRFKDIDYNLQKERIKSVSMRYNNARVILDSTSVGQPIKDSLLSEGVFVDDFKFSNKSKQELIIKLSIFIDQGHIKIPDNEILIDELESFGYRLTDSGNTIYQAPEGSHDDMVISLALAVWGLTPGKGREVVETGPRYLLREELPEKRIPNRYN